MLLVSEQKSIIFEVIKFIWTRTHTHMDVCVRNLMAFTFEILFKESCPALSHKDICRHFLRVALWFYLSCFY